LVFADDWGRHPSSSQHLIRLLLARREVYWINTIGTRAPHFDLATIHRGLEKLRAWAFPSCKPARPLPGLHVLSPKMWPWFRTALDRRLNRFLLSWQLAPLLQALSTPPVAVTMLPIVADLMGDLPVQRWVYYCVDDFTEWPGLDHVPLRQMEEQLVRKADVHIAVSEVLQDRLTQMGASSHLLTHGVDLPFWAPREDKLAPVPQLEGLERPLIVFWGMTDRRMDLGLLRRLAADLTAGTIVLVGKELSPDPTLYAIDRVVHVGVLPYVSLPLVARQAGVLIMPYADLPVTRAIQPVKLKEYLATGKPTVVRDLPAVRPWADCLDRAVAPEDFSRAVRLRLEQGLPAEQRQARARLVHESWEEKARLFEHWALGPRACRAGLPGRSAGEGDLVRRAVQGRRL
jgi:glycosyltransferase involved in cell wall biosynthesis